MPWGYDKENGPATWARSFPAAKGSKQSPIDINTKSAVFDKSLVNNPLVVNYSTEPSLHLENPGLSYKAIMKANSIISGGPLGEHKYRLAQFHFHWSHDDKCGSEHTLNGKSYAAELHLVHYNSDKYATSDESVTKSDGLAVIGVFIKVGPYEHEGFKILADSANKVKCKAAKFDTGVAFNPSCLLPDNTANYWTYEGSLTTPPCNESVQWIVMQDDITISPEQMKAMRSLCCDVGGAQPIPDNYRPPLPIGNRKLRASFN